MKSFEHIGEDFSPDPSIQIPFTTFEGWLKCHRPELLNELQLASMQAAFPKFLTRESMSDDEVEGYKRMAEQTAKGVLHFTDYFWTGRPSRRYAGDYLNEFTLPRGCYHTVCQDEYGDDRQTLANEMLAYREPETSGECYAYDLSGRKPDEGKSRAILVSFYSRPHLYNPIFRKLAKLKELTEKCITAELLLQRLVTFAKEPFKIEVPYHVEFKTIERVVDLRLPHVRAWFAKTFAEGDGRVLLKNLISQKPADIHFGLMLPTLMYPTTGGNNITTSIGLWMRLYGVNALIFPSARSDVRVTFRHGQLVDKGFWGWNLVDYREAPPPPRTFQRSWDASDWDQAGSMASIGEAPPGDEHAGSLRVDGIVERREKNFKEAIEKFYDRRFIIHPEGLDVGPVDLAFIKSKLEEGAIATTTGVTSQDEHLPAFDPGSVGELFAFPVPKSEAEAASPESRKFGWENSGKWFRVRNSDEDAYYDIRCPSCGWEDHLHWRDLEEQPPLNCPQCSYDGKTKAAPPESRVGNPQPAGVSEQGDEWKPSGQWFLERRIQGLEFEVKCPICSWTDSYYARDEHPPEKCGRCGYPKGNAEQKTDSQSNDVEQLSTCKHCGQKFNLKNPGQCSYHPQVPKWIGDTGPRGEWNKYIFPCCGQEYDNYENNLHPDEAPPQSPGCIKGKHDA